MKATEVIHVTQADLDAQDEALQESLDIGLTAIGHLEACMRTIKASEMEMLDHLKRLWDLNSRTDERRKCGDGFWTGEWRREGVEGLIGDLRATIPEPESPMAKAHPEEDLAELEAYIALGALFSIGACRISVTDDRDRGFRVECERHGRIARSDTIGGAEMLANRHGRKWMQIG